MGIAESAQSEAYEIVMQFWQCIIDKKWDELKEVLAENFEAMWPQTREIVDKMGFIEVNKNYPGIRKIEVGNMNHEYDRWDHSSAVVNQSYIKSEISDEKSIELYSISLFKIEHDENGEKKITELIEYEANTYPPPEWRRQWVNVSSKRIM